MSNFFKGQCKWNTPAFYAFVFLAGGVGFWSTLTARSLDAHTKLNMLATQLCVDIIFGLLIGYLSANCMQGWAWVLIASFLVAPIF